MFYYCAKCGTIIGLSRRLAQLERARCPRCEREITSADEVAPAPMGLLLQNSNRVDPSSLGGGRWVNMGALNQDVMVHAHRRLDRQLRFMAIVCLLRMNGTIAKGALVEQAETDLQHGQGPPGKQAAHQLLVNVTINKQLLRAITDGDAALRMLITTLESDTSLLDSAYNTADSEIEKRVRDDVVKIIQDIVKTDFADQAVRTYVGCLGKAWESLQKSYVGACAAALPAAVHLFQAEDKNYKARLGLYQKALEEEQKMQGNVAVAVAVAVAASPAPAKPKLRKSEVMHGELAKAERRRKMAEQNQIIVELYRDVAVKMKFPLKEGELMNMYELVFDARPPLRISPCARCGKPSTHVCGRCREAPYCSKECQRAAWPAHKLVCKPKAANADAKASSVDAKASKQ